METSLIATSSVVEDVSDAPMMDIPNDLDIEVRYNVSLMHIILYHETSMMYCIIGGSLSGPHNY